MHRSAVRRKTCDTDVHVTDRGTGLVEHNRPEAFERKFSDLGLLELSGSARNVVPCVGAVQERRDGEHDATRFPGVQNLLDVVA